MICTTDEPDIVGAWRHVSEYANTYTASNSYRCTAGRNMGWYNQFPLESGQYYASKNSALSNLGGLDVGESISCALDGTPVYVSLVRGDVDALRCGPLLKVPCLHLNGCRDSGKCKDTESEERRLHLENQSSEGEESR